MMWFVGHSLSEKRKKLYAREKTKSRFFPSNCLHNYHKISFLPRLLVIDCGAIGGGEADAGEKKALRTRKNKITPLPG